MKATLSKFVNEEGLRRSLIMITALSWFVFPLLVNLLNPSIFNTIFAACALVVTVSVAISLPRNQLALQPIHKMILGCWIGYLLALLLATLESASTYSLIHWCILLAKFLFCLFLLVYINEKYIVATLRIYANLMVLTVVFAVVAIVFAALDIQPLTIVNIQGTLTNFYFASYYTPHYSPICMPLPIYRIQGLSEEPGAYAFELLPAFFWLLIAEKAYVRSAVIALGICLTISLGVTLLLFILFLIMVRKYSGNFIVAAFILGVIGSVGLLYPLSSACQTSYLENLLLLKSQSKDDFVSKPNGKDDFASKANGKDDFASKFKSKDDKATLAVLDDCTKTRGKNECIKYFQYNVASSAYGKVHSFTDRYDGMVIALGYLRDHVIGTGTGLGMSKVNALAVGTSAAAVGYVVAVLESGIVGGFLYMCLFTIMGWLAFKTIITTKMDSFDERVRIVIALSVCSVLVMGAQRIQPDITLWHMWIYAMLLYVLQRNNGSLFSR